MAVLKPTNFGRATVASPPSGTGGLSFTVAAGGGANFPSPGAGEYFYGVFTNAARSAYEIVKVEARSTDAFTVASGGRGADGTSAATWNTGDIFYLPTTRAMWDETSFSAASMAISALTPAADRVPYFTSATAGALATLTSFARTILDDANAATARVTLGAEPAFASGTRMVFQQTAAPTGYTKVTDAAYNDAALRFVTGSVTPTGGADAFSTHFGTGKATDSHVLATSEIPSHTHAAGTYAAASHAHTTAGRSGGGTLGSNDAFAHSVGDFGRPTTGGDFTVPTSNVAPAVSGTSSATGSGGGHTHTLSNFNIKFVDSIIAAKD